MSIKQDQSWMPIADAKACDQLCGIGLWKLQRRQQNYSLATE